MEEQELENGAAGAEGRTDSAQGKPDEGILDHALEDGDGMLAGGLDDFFSAMEAIGKSSIADERASGDEARDDVDGDADSELDLEDTGEEPGAEEDPDGEEQQAEEEQPDEEEPEEKEEESPAADVAALLATLKEKTGLDVSTAEELVDTVALELQANEDLLQLFEQQPRLLALTKACMEGMSLQEALLEVVGDQDEADPEVIKARAKAEAREELRQRQIEAAKAKAETAARTFQTAHKLDDKQFNAFQERIRPYIYGDAVTGELPGDFLEVMYRGLQYEQAVAEARKEGKRDGKNEAVNEHRNRRQKRGDSVPYARSGKADDAQNPREASLEDLASSFASARGGILEDF